VLADEVLELTESLRANYTFGHSAEALMRHWIKRGGGKAYILCTQRSEPTEIVVDGVRSLVERGERIVSVSCPDGGRGMLFRANFNRKGITSVFPHHFLVLMPPPRASAPPDDRTERL
jgi:hypothetical protein